jgi:hypothetical protein
MPVEVQSPISRKGSRVGSIHRIAESPGSRSMPGARGDQSGEGEQPPEQHVHVRPEMHVHAEAPEQEQEALEPEERGDSLGLMRRLADRLLGRRPSLRRDHFVNFPRDR